MEIISALAGEAARLTRAVRCHVLQDHEWIHQWWADSERDGTKPVIRWRLVCLHCPRASTGVETTEPNASSFPAPAPTPSFAPVCGLVTRWWAAISSRRSARPA